MSNTLHIANASTIYVGRVSTAIDELMPRRRIIVITDVNVDRLYPDLVHRFDHIVIGIGESCKSLRTAEMLYKRLMEMGADRSTFILGIGGGIVTDVAGYVASTYMRGVEFGFISTTLLGQVDASVGGKNGVNVADYKNMVGTFSHPRFVILDVEMLRTLPPRELRAGMAEVVKTAMVGDRSLFNLIEQSAGGNIYTSRELMERIVYASVAVKCSIVERDERESGLRRILNLGHTIGHAIEKCTRDINHGEAVAIGLSVISHAAVRYGAMAESDAMRVDTLLERLGFELKLPVPIHNLLREVRLDKKKRDNILRVVMPKAIGECCVVEMPFDEFEKLLTYDK